MQQHQRLAEAAQLQQGVGLLVGQAGAVRLQPQAAVEVAQGGRRVAGLQGQEAQVVPGPRVDRAHPAHLALAAALLEPGHVGGDLGGVPAVGPQRVRRPRHLRRGRRAADDGPQQGAGGVEAAFADVADGLADRPVVVRQGRTGGRRPRSGRGRRRRFRPGRRGWRFPRAGRGGRFSPGRRGGLGV